MSENLEWVNHASCKDLGTEELARYFPAPGAGINDEDLQRCYDCPVRLECLEHAYEHKFPGGYFGGFSPKQRRKPIEDLYAEVEAQIN